MPAFDLHTTVAAFKIAADPTRLQILAFTAGKEVCVGDLSGLLKQSQPTVSHHLALMRISGFIESRRDGKNNRYKSTPKGLAVLKAAAVIAPVKPAKATA